MHTELERQDELRRVARGVARRLKISVSDAEAAYALVHHAACDDPTCRLNAWAEVVANHRIQEMVSELLPTAEYAKSNGHLLPAERTAGFEERLALCTKRHASVLSAMQQLSSLGTVTTFIQYLTQLALDGETGVDPLDIN